MANCWLSEAFEDAGVDESGADLGLIDGEAGVGG